MNTKRPGETKKKEKSKAADKLYKSCVEKAIMIMCSQENIDYLPL